MALEVFDIKEDQIKVKVDYGDLKALKDVVKKWNFKDEGAALRFAFTALYLTEPGKLFKENQEGDMLLLQPTEEYATLSPINSY